MTLPGLLWGLSLSGVAQAGPHTAIVGFDETVDIALFEEDLQHLGATEFRCVPAFGLCLAHFVDSPPLGALAMESGVRYAELDAPMTRLPTTAPASLTAPGGGVDESGVAPPGADLEGTGACPDLWDLQAIGLGAAWESVGETGENAPVVAVQDAGFLLTHIDLVGQTSGTWDYADNDSNPEVVSAASVPAHGTFIAGIVAGKDDNDVGRVGLIPSGKLNLEKIADSSGAFYFSYAISAMADIAEGDLGIKVLNYSIAGSSDNSGFRDAVAGLGDAGILLVAAAANCSSADCPEADNDSNPVYPANYSTSMAHVVSVAGSTRDDALNPYSHYGASSVDLAAPGVDICSLGVDSDTDTFSAAGTSYATPLVAGAAALLWGAFPELSPLEVRRVLRASSDETAELAGRVRSGGRLSVERAVQTAVPRLSVPASLAFGERTTLTVSLDNVGADGEAVLLVFPGPALDLLDAPGWTIHAFAAGDSVDLPDAGEWTATERGWRLSADVAADSENTVSLDVAGTTVGTSTALVRAVMSSTGADYLNSPYDTGSLDPTGWLAEGVAIEVQSVWEQDSGGPPTDSDQPADTGAFGDDGGTPGGGSGGRGAPDCGCEAGSTVGGGLGLVLLILGARRREG